MNGLLRRQLSLARVVICVGFVGFLGAGLLAFRPAHVDRLESVAAYALLANGDLSVSPLDGRSIRTKVAEHELRQTSSRVLAPVVRNRLAVLLPAKRSELTQLAFVDMKTLNVLARGQLPGIDATADARVLLPLTRGRILVVGDRPAPPGRTPVAWIFDVTAAPKLVLTWSVRKSSTKNWTVFDAAVPATGDVVFLSYHGDCGKGSLCTTGADVVDLDSGKVLCRSKYPDSGCVNEIHGELAGRLDGAVATGGDEGEIVAASRDGLLVGRWRSQLPRNHLVRIAYDAPRRRAYIVGSCLYAGGYARIDIPRGLRWRRGLGAAGSDPVCGERISARKDVLAFAEGVERAGPSSSSIIIADARNGRIHRRVRTRAGAIDVLVAAQPRS